MLSDRLSSLRRSRNLSQAQLAKKLNLSPSAVGMYEQGRRVPDLATLTAMTRLFDVSLDYLVTGKEHTSRNPSHRPASNCPCRRCFREDHDPL